MQEYFAIKNQLSAEAFPALEPGGPPRFYAQLPQEERAKLLKDRLKKYCQRVGGLHVCYVTTVQEHRGLSVGVVVARLWSGGVVVSVQVLTPTLDAAT